LLVSSPVAEHCPIFTAQRSYRTPRRADARRSWKTCVCTAGMSFFTANGRRATRSGWREPAVVPGRECARRNVISPQKPIADASANPTHGGLTFAALDSVVGVRRTLFAAPCERDQLPTHLLVSSPVAEHCPIFTAQRSYRTPRRADARRSWERAFVQREYRFSQGTNVLHQERLA
jgi:hypothetical protein